MSEWYVHTWPSPHSIKPQHNCNASARLQSRFFQQMNSVSQSSNTILTFKALRVADYIEETSKNISERIALLKNTKFEPCKMRDVCQKSGRVQGCLRWMPGAWNNNHHRWRLSDVARNRSCPTTLRVLATSGTGLHNMSYRTADESLLTTFTMKQTYISAISGGHGGLYKDAYTWFPSGYINSNISQLLIAALCSS